MMLVSKKIKNNNNSCVRDKKEHFQLNLAIIECIKRAQMKLTKHTDIDLHLTCYWTHALTHTHCGTRAKMMPIVFIMELEDQIFYYTDGSSTSVPHRHPQPFISSQ